MAEGYHEPSIIKWGPFLVLAVTILGLYGSGIHAWSTLRGDLNHLRDNINNLQTPLSAAVLTLKGRLDELERNNIKLSDTVSILERSGTAAGNAERNMIRKDIERSFIELSVVNERLTDIGKRLDDISRLTIYNDMIIRNIMGMPPRSNSSDVNKKKK